MSSLWLIVYLMFQSHPRCETAARVTRTSAAVSKDATAFYVNSTRCMEPSTHTVEWFLMIDSEMMKIREVQTGIVVVSRAQRNTKAVDHPVNALVVFGPTVIFQ